ncbi:MAG: FixH family protein [Chitinophagaceae bacterium]|nr:FixH family protein [Chitinophagaceae bacterium]
MKKIILSIFLPALLFILVISSCKKEENVEPDPTLGLTKQAEGYAVGAATKVVVYTKEALVYTGYNKFYIALYDSVTGKRVDEAHIHLMPMMNMGAMQHSAPYDNPISENAANHLFPCSVVFIMPSMGGGSWTVNLNVHNHVSDKEGELTIPFTVVDPAKSKMKSFTAAHDGGKYFISLIEPSAPKVGINDMEIAIYKRATMMSFPADSSLLVTLTPEMPTMGHGSPNNVNPAHTGNGHYKGKVNFTMTGLWKLNLDYMAGTAVADTTTQFFEVQF